MPESTENTQTDNPQKTDGQSPTPSGSQVPPASTEPKTEGGNFDDLGYPIPAPKEEATKETETKKQETEKVDSTSGYGDEPVADDKKQGEVSGYGDEPPAEPKKEDPPAEKPTEDTATEGEFKIEEPGDLLPEEVTQLTDFIKKHKLSNEIAQALVDNKKAEIKEVTDSIAKTAADKAADAQRIKREWHKELKDDPDFGGEKFAQNVSQAEKVVEDFLPGLKKRLTDSKGMLPPYVMKDLAKLAGHLYGTEKLTQGDPAVPKKVENKEDEHLAFYDS